MVRFLLAQAVGRPVIRNAVDDSPAEFWTLSAPIPRLACLLGTSVIIEQVFGISGIG
jgi:ABC-type dipeptide/oligopeptide/nickel transport system permease component